MTTQTMSPRPTLAATAAAGTRVRDLRIGGGLLFLAGAVILLGIISAEALYPVEYSTGANAISDLGGTEPPGALVYQPSATIFNVSMMAIGMMVIAGSVFVQRALGRRAVTIPLALLGIGALGVGVFPGDTGTIHALFAMMTFIAGGVAAVAAALVTAGPFRYLCAACGTVALLTLAGYLIMGDGAPLAALGLGGLERWIVYPIVLWMTGFGGYLAGEGAP
jgi:hypothetical membrane protein